MYTWSSIFKQGIVMSWKNHSLELHQTTTTDYVLLYIILEICLEYTVKQE